MNRSSSLSVLAWLFGIASALLAAFLLTYYVNLLQDAVARGSQFKYAQQEQPARAKAVYESE